MRSSFALFLFVACTVACADTPEDRAQDLVASSAKCGDVYEPDVFSMSCRNPSAPPEQIASCMNDALSKHTRAMVAWWKEDHDLYGYVTYAFAIDGTLDVVDYYPGRSPTTDGPHVAGEKTCSGTFRADTYMCPFHTATIAHVTLDGCPIGEL